MTAKRCARCGFVLDIELFNREAASKDGRGRWCRACHKTYAAERPRPPLSEDKRKHYRARARAAYAADPDSRRSYIYAWRESRPGYALAVDRKYRTNHVEECRERRRAWQKSHPEYNRAQTRDHNHRKRAGGLPSDVNRQSWEVLVVEWNGRCAYCGIRPERITQDHVVPLARGGSHTIANLRPACQRCNSSKGTKLLAEWIAC